VICTRPRSKPFSVSRLSKVFWKFSRLELCLIVPSMEAQLKQVRVSNRRVERHDLSAADQMSYDAFDQRWFGDIV
jgi:hypothetical protein